MYNKDKYDCLREAIIMKNKTTRKDDHEWLREVIKMGNKTTRKDDIEVNDVLRLVYSLGVQGVGVNIRVNSDGSYEILVNPPLLGLIEEHEIDPDASEK